MTMLHNTLYYIFKQQSFTVNTHTHTHTHTHTLYVCLYILHNYIYRERERENELKLFKDMFLIKYMSNMTFKFK